MSEYAKNISFCETTKEKAFVVITAMGIPAILAISYGIYSSQNPCETAEDISSHPIVIANFLSCLPNASGFTRYYFGIPGLILSLISTCLILISLILIWSVNYHYLILQWRVVVSFIIFVIDLLLTFFYIVLVPTDKYAKESQTYIECVASHPRETSPSPCEFNSSYEYGPNFLVTITDVSMPIFFCFAAYFSCEWFPHWWKTLLYNHRLPTMSKSIRSVNETSR
jgi:hypothetical protein